MKRRISITIALATVALAGVLAAALVVAPVARAWDWTNLPNGYNVYVSSYQKADGSSCHIVRIDGQLMGDDCVDVNAMYAAIDAYVNATICQKNPAAGGAACVTTTTQATTTQAPAPPPVTTTSPVETTPAPPPPPSEPPPTTVTVTVTTTTTTADPSISDRLAAIEAQLKDLQTRVERLELGSVAADLVFQQAIADGADIATAAALARGTFLNVQYSLGEYSA